MERTDNHAQTAYAQLTEKQKGFVDALCLDPNISGRAAAIKAGYVEESAHVEASRLLRSANIRKALGELLADTAPTTNEIAARWDRVSRSTLDDFYSLELYEEATTIQRPLVESIEAVEESISFEEEYAARAVELLGLVDEEKQDYLDKSQHAINKKRLRVLEMQMQLERDPEATYGVPGPPIVKERLVLDLVKAQAAGVLDLAKAIKPTQYGIAIELRDPDAALDKLARMAGAYEKDNEQNAPKIMPEIRVYTGAPPLATSEKDIAE